MLVAKILELKDEQAKAFNEANKIYNEAQRIRNVNFSFVLISSGKRKESHAYRGRKEPHRVRKQLKH